MNSNTTSGVAWLALIVAALALVLAWTAFNRAGVDLEEMVAQEVEEAQVLRSHRKLTEGQICLHRFLGSAL